MLTLSLESPGVKHQPTLHFAKMMGESKRKKSECQVCGKEFALSDSFRKHIRTHLESKRFKCEICEKGFNEKSENVNSVEKDFVN